jgi:hypothetical protein
MPKTVKPEPKPKRKYTRKVKPNVWKFKNKSIKKYI